MVKNNVEFDSGKTSDIQNDVIHFEALICDLIGILGKSISFCIHSGDSINGLLSHYLRSNTEIDENKNNNSDILVQESSFQDNSTDFMNINTSQNDTDYIRFNSGGVLHSLPKTITNSLVGTYLYEQSQKDRRTTDGSIYLDYPFDDSCAPLLIDSLMNNVINIDQLKIKDQLQLLDLFEFCELPLPEELTKIQIQRENIKKCNNADNVVLYINNQENEIIKKYCKSHGIWNNYVNNYNNGYIDYDKIENKEYMKINYEYIDYINEYIINNCIYIFESETYDINRENLEKEMYSIFGDIGKNIVKKGWKSNYVFRHSKILDSTDEKPLVKWLGEEKRWKLLFRASEHNYKASEFHKYCHDNYINIFGGYTDQDWENYPISKWHSKEFIFTISNEHNIPPTKYEYTSSDRSCGIYCNAGAGPCFGNLSDITIFTSNKNDVSAKCSATHYGEVNTNQKSSLFVNTNKPNKANEFKVYDYEVWGRL
ncbi:hypothetical protein WA158_004293 [Blastocystis sp. Blastoise]